MFGKLSTVELFHIQNNFLALEDICLSETSIKPAVYVVCYNHTLYDAISEID